MPLTFAESLPEVAQLVKLFRTNFPHYHAPTYKEASARIDFVDPLFIALGWDVRNTQHHSPIYKEVEVEESRDVEGHTKQPDYTFRLGREAVFFVEAKRPGITLKTAAEPAYQIRRYAWSQKLPLSILTDFEELAVYEGRTRPTVSDKASAARVNFFTYDEYADRWREIWEVFSREAVLSGSFQQYADAAKGKRGTTEVDAEFLKDIERWRDVLARNLALRNPGIADARELNDAVQRMLDRLIFLRIAEDRGIEPYERLRSLTLTPTPASAHFSVSPTGRGGRALPSPLVGRGGRAAPGDGVYRGLIDLYRAADRRYNSGLFDFTTGGDGWMLELSIDDKVLKDIIGDLYYPHSPYQFDLIPVEILGNVYEQFLGKVIRLTAGHQAKVEEKPEVKKAGGVYYTPAYIVAYIVRQTVGKAIEGKNPKQLMGLRVLDMACGSGSFLLGAYQYLLDYYLKWYVEHEDLTGGAKSSVARRDAVLHLSGLGVWRLTIAEKKRILTEHLFGVDIDRQAVEVTKLSLLLKVLEGENDESLQLRLFDEDKVERALPNLEANIKCGNSLIGPDYFTDQLLPDPDELRRVNPFDWQREFPPPSNSPRSQRARTGEEPSAPSPVDTHLSTGEGRGGGFDVIIGNPPWGGDIDKDLDYFHLAYPATTQEHTDSFKLFIEGSLRLARDNGFVSLIVPNTLLRQRRLKDVRALMLQAEIISLTDLGEDVFKGVVAPSCVYVARKAPPKKDHKIQIVNLAQSTNTAKAELLRDGTFLKTFVKQQSIKDNPDFEFANAIKKGNVPTHALGEFRELECKDAGINYQRVNVGMQEKGKSDLAERLLYEGKQQKLRDKMFWKGSDIDRYWIANATTRWCRPYYSNFIRANEVVHLSEHVYDTTPKILLRQTADHIIATVDERGVWFGRSIIAILLQADSTYDIRYFLGLLNSRYFRWLYAGLVQETGRVFAQVKLSKLKQLPIRPIDFTHAADKAAHDRIVTLVNTLLQLHPRLASVNAAHDREMLQRQIDAADRQIDALVYQLYGLTEEEIEIVAGR